MDRRKIAGLLFACIITSFTPAFLLGQRVALSGRVHSQLNTPIAGAKIVFYNLAGDALDDCSTNSRGEFSSRNPVFRKNLKVRIEVHAEGFAMFTREYTLRTGQFGTIKLKPLSGIKGIVRTDQGAYLDGVVLTFFDAAGERRGVSTTGINGAYQSDKLFQNEETIRVVASKPDFSEESKTVKTAGTGFVNVDFVLETRTVISGFVLDEVNLDPIPEAEVSFFDRNNRLITTRTTNQSGYYDFDNPFTLGEIVRVRMEKLDYRPGEETIIIAKGVNRLDFKLLKKIDEGIKVIVRVYDRKGKKTIEGATIKYQNRGPQESQTSRDGETQFRVNQRGGYDLPLRIHKPGFREVQITQRLREDVDNYVNLNLLKAKSICPCFLYGAIGLAVVSGVSYGLSRKPYTDHKDFKNLDRINDYDKANRLVRISTVSAGLAGASFGGWIICKLVEKKRIKDMGKPGQHFGLRPLIPAAGDGFQLGIAYTF